MTTQRRRETIRRIEEIAANAVPAALLQIVSGWRLRYNYGVTRRANSILAFQHEQADNLEEKIGLAEAFYHRFGQAPRFQLCPVSEPEGLDDVLERRGYLSIDSVVVQLAAVDDVMANTAPNPTFDVETTQDCTASWYALCRVVENPYTTVRQRAGKGDVRRQMFGRLPQETAFMRLEQQQKTVAAGLGVLERGYVGLFNLVTHPEHRRQGAASTLIYHLASWAKAQGAHTLYLQVSQDNLGARHVYERAGFDTLYHYHYRELSS